MTFLRRRFLKDDSGATAIEYGLIALLVSVGIIVAALPSVSDLQVPADVQFCPAISPPLTSCAPGAHLVVVGLATLLLASAWLATDVALRRTGTPSDRVAALMALSVVAIISWAAARIPQPYFSAWNTLLGVGGN